MSLNGIDNFRALCHTLSRRHQNTMTTKQILKAVSPLKPVSHRQLIRYLVAFNIKPLGIRQRPQQYPADTADRILKHLGFETGAAAPKGAVANGSANLGRRAVSLISLPQIRAAKPRITKKGTSK